MDSDQSHSPLYIGVGFDTARYGHHVTFLRDDRRTSTTNLGRAHRGLSAPRGMQRSAVAVEASAATDDSTAPSTGVRVS